MALEPGDIRQLFQREEQGTIPAFESTELSWKEAIKRLLNIMTKLEESPGK